MAKMAKWRRPTVEFKRQVVEQMKTCENIGALARELDLERKLLYIWKYQFEGRPEPRRANLAKKPEERKDKQVGEEITKLKLALAEKTLENDFFRSALYLLAHPREALSQANGVLPAVRDPRLREAGNQVWKRVGLLLDVLGRMEVWLGFWESY